MASNREREELHKAIWSIADDLRGSVDGWDFKQYILGIMFYRYISENIANYINEGERKAGDTTFDYAKLKDSEAESERANLVKEKGFFIRPSELFCNVIKSAKSDSATFTDVEGKTKNIKDNLNEYLEMIFNNIENSAKGAESEDDFSGLFDDIDVNSNKLGSTVTKRNEKLVKILDGIAGINLGNYQDNNIDAFGDAYEFLMSMYASNAGKSGGEFYTPQEVSELLTRLAIVGKTSVNKVYDLFAGAGGLSEGFIQAGFNPIAHVEMNQFAAQTLVTRSAYYYLKQTNQLNTYYRYLRGEIKHDELYREEVQEGLREQAGAYCPYCGKQNHNEDAKFCMYCGMRFRV